MSAPSTEHEFLVMELETLAVLAGFHGMLTLPGRLRPDVARIRPDGGARMLADAKATESPRCAATARRLTRYARFLALDPRPGDILAIAYGPADQRREWARLLGKIARSVGLASSEATTSALAIGLHVVHLRTRTAVGCGRDRSAPTVVDGTVRGDAGS